MKNNNFVQKLFLKPRPFATLALIGATTLAFTLSSCDNASKNKAKTDSSATKTEEKVAEKETVKPTEKEVEKPVENVAKPTETTVKAEGNAVDVTFLRATWYAGSTKYYFKNAKGEEIEISLLNDGMEDAALYNPKMPKESLLEGDDPKREGPPGENPKFIGKKFKIIYDAKDKEKVIEIRKDF